MDTLRRGHDPGMFVCARLLVIVASVITLAALTLPAAAFGDYTEHGYVKVRDGVELSYTVIRPSKSGRYPALLNFAGYTSGSDPGSSNAIPPAEMVKDGYATIGVNVRGSGCSGGTFEVYDPRWATDGYDIVEWIARQSGRRAGWAYGAAPSRASRS